MSNSPVTFKQLQMVNLTNVKTLSVQQRSVFRISPYGTYIFKNSLHRNLSSNYLINLKTNKTIQNIIKTSIIGAIFSYNQQQLYFSNLIGVSKINITSQINNKSKEKMVKVVPIILESKTLVDNKTVFVNNITFMTISKDYRTLYYINRSSLYALDLNTTEVTLQTNILDRQLCSPQRINFHEPTNTVISLSLIRQSFGGCRVCQWKIIDNQFRLSANTTINQCYATDIVFVPYNQTVNEEVILLTKSNFNHNRNNSILLNLTTLNLIGTTKQNNSHTSNIAHIRPFQNYIIQFFQGSTSLWLYRDYINNNPVQIKMKNNINNILYSTTSNQFYIFDNPIKQYDVMVKYQIEFDCTKINNVVAISQDKTTCRCNDDRLIFNKSSLSCNKISYQKINDKYNCPSQHSFNSFNLNCELDCALVTNALPVKSYQGQGYAKRCACQIPYQWNFIKKDCSFVNCYYIKNSLFKYKNGDSCECIQNFRWNNKDLKCQYQLKPNPDNPTNIPETNPIGLIVFLVCFLIILIIVGIVFYYRHFCKKSKNEQQARNENEQDNRPKDDNESDTNRRVNLQSQQILREQVIKNGQNQMKSTSRGIQKEKQIDDNIDNFSIGQEQELGDEQEIIQAQFEKQQEHQDNQTIFSEINSNLNEPLQEQNKQN